MSIQSYKSGFTLIETIVYSALCGLLLTILIGTAYIFLETSQKLESQMATEESGNFILRKIHYALSQNVPLGDLESDYPFISNLSASTSNNVMNVSFKISSTTFRVNRYAP